MNVAFQTSIFFIMPMMIGKTDPLTFEIELLLDLIYVFAYHLVEILKIAEGFLDNQHLFICDYLNDISLG